MATVVACTGFEFGTTAGITTGNAGNPVFDGSTGTFGTDLQIIAGAARSGSYGLRVALTAKNLFWNTGTLGTGKTDLVVSLWFKLSTNPTTDTDIISMDSSGVTDRAGFYFQNSTKKLVAWIGAGSQVSAALVNDGAWHLLQWRYNCAANPHTMAWSLDGVVGTPVSLATATQTVARLAIGNRSSGTGVCDYDDILVSSTGADHPMGGHRVALMSPDPAGTVTLSGTAANFQTFTGNGTLIAWNAATALANIDEVPPTISASADGFAQVTAAAGDYVEIPMTVLPAGSGESVSAVRMLVPGWAASTTAANLGFRSFNGTTETVLQAGTVDPNFDNSTTTPAWVCKMLTLADVVDLGPLSFRVGFSSALTPAVGVHAIYAEVAVLPGPVPRIVLAPSGAAQRAGSW